MAWPTSPDVSFERFAPHYPTRLNVWKNPITQVGGNVVLVIFHGGGWGGNSMLNSHLTSAEEYDLANYVMTSGLTGQRWSVVSVDYRMAAYDSGVEPSYPSFFPDAWEDCAMAIQAVRENALVYGTSGTGSSWGINPNKIVAFGVSAGAGMALVNSFRRSAAVPGSVWTVARRFVYRLPSTPSIVINYIGGIDIRFDTGLGVESFRHDLVGNIFGTPAIPTGSPGSDNGVGWSRVPNALKAAASPLAYLEAPTLQARPRGVYNLYFTTAPDTKPYDSLHPSEQGPIIHAALQAKGIDSDLKIMAPGSWKNYTGGASSPSFGISGPIVAFCEARL